MIDSSPFGRANQSGFLFAATLVFVCSCNRAPGGSLPSSLNHLPAGLNNQKLELRGIYQDGWVAETGSVVLRQPVGDQVLTIRGMVPKIGEAKFHTRVELRLDDRSLTTRPIGVGEFSISAPVATVGATRRVTISFSGTQQLPGGDGRGVGGRLQFIGFEPAGSGDSAVVSDVVRGDGIELGDGWGQLETFQHEIFRWIDNDAQVRIAAAKPGEAVLSITVESGPGVRGRAFLLKVLDESRRQVDAVQVERRGAVKLFLPVAGGKPSEFLLHVDGGGERAPNDPRILNFRVFRLSVDL